MKLNNDFVAIPVTIGVHEHFHDSLKENKKLFKELRTSMMPFGYLNTFAVSNSLPFTLPKHNVDFFSDKYTLVFSNLNSSKIRYNFNGKKQVGAYYFVPTIGRISFGVSIVTCENICSMAVYGDKVAIDDPQEFVEMFKHRIQETLTNENVWTKEN